MYTIWYLYIYIYALYMYPYIYILIYAGMWPDASSTDHFERIVFVPGHLKRLLDSG